jgi:hypothetical protein
VIALDRSGWQRGAIDHRDIRPTDRVGGRELLAEPDDSERPTASKKPITDP